MILVTGASGFVGGALADVLAQGRRPVMSVARRMPDLAMGEEGSGTASLDVTDVAALRQAGAGVSAIVHLAGVSPGTVPERSDHEVAAMRALLELARARSVDRFVFLSATGAARGASLPWLRAKAEAEDLLRESGVPHVILRAGIVVGEQSRWLNALALAVRTHDTLRLPVLCHGTLRALSVSDLGIALATALDHHVMKDQTVELGAGSPMSLHGLIDAVAGRLGRSVRVLQRPFGGVRLARVLGTPGEAAREQSAGLVPDGSVFEKWFSIVEAPETAFYDRALPMDRVDLAESLREMPWGEPPPRPGQPLPVLQPDSGEPLFIPGRHLLDDGEDFEDPAREFGRVDPFGHKLSTDFADPDESGADTER